MQDLISSLYRSKKKFDEYSLQVDLIVYGDAKWYTNDLTVVKMIKLLIELEELLVSIMEKANEYDQKIDVDALLRGEDIESVVVRSPNGTHVILDVFKPDRDAVINIGESIAPREEFKAVLERTEEFQEYLVVMDEIDIMNTGWKFDQKWLKTIMFCLERMLKKMVEIKKRCRARLMIDPPMLNINNTKRFSDDIKEGLSKRVLMQKRFSMSG